MPFLVCVLNTGIVEVDVSGLELELLACSFWVSHVQPVGTMPVFS